MANKHCASAGKKLSQTNANGYLDLDKKSKELELAHNSNYKTLISGSRVQTLVNGTLYILEVVKEDGKFFLLFILILLKPDLLETISSCSRLLFV